MIRFIAAIDNKRGMANEQGIPWQGKVPGDIAYFREKTLHKNVLMGYRTYTEFAKPLSDRRNLVATTKNEQLHQGFEAVPDAHKFLQDSKEDIWVIGGPGLFESVLDLADELYLTRLQTDFNCTKFFPEFETTFKLSKRSEPIFENGISYYFEVWEKR